jgi:hypothetical protein
MDEGATAETIAACLDLIAAERMGLGHSRRGAEASRQAIQTLVALRSKFEKN